MADAKECDRCGEIYGKVKWIISHPFEISRENEKKDLCHNCEKDLEHFYDYEFEEIKDVKKLLKKGSDKKK